MTKTERHSIYQARLTGAPLPVLSSAAALAPGPFQERPPCAREGPVLVPCHSCGSEARHVRDCEVHGTCTRGEAGKDVGAVCSRCDDYLPPVGTVLRLDEANTYPGLPGRRFNAGLLARGAGYVYCWRDGWAGSNLWACRLDKRLRPVGAAVRLEVRHPAADYGREDPQLFEYRGALHVAFVGVQSGSRRRVMKTNVLYVRLSEALAVEEVFAPKAPGVSADIWQKNWQFFESGRDLYAVYHPRPHRVLRLDGERCEWVAETPGLVGWTGGEPRGGATPVRVGDEWWSFFHDSVDIGGRKTYRVGLYTFRAAPPFEVSRYAPEPILVADRATNTEGNYCEVVFPRGAAFLGDRWVLSSGVHDRHGELRVLDHADLERRLVPAG